MLIPLAQVFLVWDLLQHLGEGQMAGYLALAVDHFQVMICHRLISNMYRIFNNSAPQQ